MSGYASTGRRWKETAPQAVSRIARANTTNRLLRAKSTSVRIIVVSVSRVSLVVDFVLKRQRILHDLLARLEPPLYLQLVIRDRIAGQNLQPMELVLRCGNVHPVTVMKTQDG